MTSSTQTRPAQTDALLAPNINTLWSRALIDELARCGLRDICISPGSRSTPLVVQAFEHPDIRDISIVDERSAAFFALGLAKATGRPVALICTSGTAAANYFPAVCEASEADIPLIILSADRPADLHDCGGSQTMDQHKLFGDRIRWFHGFAQPEATASKLTYLRSIACRAFTHAKSGPVHLNIPFRKPLEPIEVPASSPDFVPTELAKTAPVATMGRPDGRPYLQISTGLSAPDSATISALLGRLKTTKRPMILAGADERGAYYRDALRDFAENIGAPIFAEPTSAMRHWNERGPNILSAGDLLFSSPPYTAYSPDETPDLIIRTGRAPLLWALQKWLRNLDGVEQIVVGPTLDLNDPEHFAAQQISCDERNFFEALNARLADGSQTISGSPRWVDTHRQRDTVAADTLSTQLLDITQLNSASIWDTLGQELPEGAGIFVSNSMSTRHLDTYMCRANATLDVHFNRGLNGIDGIIATGLGLAMGRQYEAPNDAAPTVIVIGDVALRHDLSALLLAAEIGVEATVLVVDNAGGAIFDYLPITKFEKVHERHFTTAPPLSVEAMLPGAITRLEANTSEALKEALNESFGTPGLQVIHVKIDPEFDKQTTDALRKRVGAAIASH
ncbi:2-succinyl-5-enolpyruvyl-6-hydroxy-3-cyclohexene-1-carboxylic-acid synthase [Bradymonas sediminis]|nr:2-succinyl-5-enolpyruvyl-6-hydroxy-3-cyclohexene-1-carboxylic-acid synthase [Bradymonas sediminis]TDP77580.1 2-succinyl-5-enolpyruvyl-6-hydroxy-3-cyclohexene-1-carboxylate synthase [Bradymonas sediminis]